MARSTLLKASMITLTTRQPFTPMWAARYQLLTQIHLQYLETLSAEQTARPLQLVIRGVEFAQEQIIHLELGSMPMAAEFMLVC